MAMDSLHLNERAARLCDEMERRAVELRLKVRVTSGVSRIIDCGVQATGGLAAGLLLARCCLADLASVTLVPGTIFPGPAIQVMTDQPVAACMAAQYAGWQIAQQKYFAMGSGPMRAARGKEPLLEEIGYREGPKQAVGVLETDKLPPDEVCDLIAAECGVTPDHLTLLVARTASQAGTMQVVARSLETALHKLHVIGFDLSQVVSGYGIAPLPPVAAHDLAAIGWTNDAVLYGGQVTLWVRGDDDAIADLGPRVPSSGSADFGEPFAAIYERYDRDFYKIDPLLFSPAQATFINLDTGRSFTFGMPAPEILRKSFWGT